MTNSYDWIALTAARRSEYLSQSLWSELMPIVLRICVSVLEKTSATFTQRLSAKTAFEPTTKVLDLMASRTALVAG